MSADRLLDLAADSGGILYLMALLLLIALTVIIEKTLFLRLAIRRGQAITDAVVRLHHLDLPALEALARRTPNGPHAAVLTVPLRHPELRDSARLGELLEEAVMLQAPRIDSRLWMLDTIITLAPLLGLLGTIVGMFNTFQALGTSGAAPTQVTGGIAEALVATACGLFIAIIGLVFFNSLNNYVRVIVHQMETIKIMLVNRLDGLGAGHVQEDEIATVRTIRRSAES